MAYGSSKPTYKYTAPRSPCALPLSLPQSLLRVRASCRVLSFLYFITLPRLSPFFTAREILAAPLYCSPQRGISPLFPDPRELGRTNPPPPTPAGRARRATKLLRAYVAGSLSHRTSSSWTPRTTIIHGSTSPSPTTVSTPPLDRPARRTSLSP
jgi:hypothetical protein